MAAALCLSWLLSLPAGLLAADSLPDPNRIECAYRADRPSDRAHADTDPPSLLTDGLWGSASSQSVQYPGDTTLTVDLGRRQPIAKVRAVVYQRTSGKGGSNSIYLVIAHPSTGRLIVNIGEKILRAYTQDLRGHFARHAQAVLQRAR